MKMKILILLVSIGTLSGCAALFGVGAERRQADQSSSLMDFLYPHEKSAPAPVSQPSLPVPMRVGLAFLPSRSVDTLGSLDAAHKEALLQRIRTQFIARKFIAEITIIPDYYLSRGMGFDGLAGVQRLNNVDVMALVSYDQVAHENDNDWSLGYLTIVGMVALKGTRHDVSTLIDLAVVDAASRTLILRAGGTDNRHGNETLINEPRRMREAATAGFDAATTNLIQHFDAALTQLQSDVHEGKANLQVRNRSGGGGALGRTDLLLFAPLLLIGRFRVRRPRARIE